MILLVIVLEALCVFLLFRVYALEKNLRWGAKQLKERREAASAAPLRLAAPNAAAEALLSEVNALLRDIEEERTGFQGRELALRRQIANVSHDLRTPLTSILGYLQLLEGDALSPEERREYLGVVESRAKALQSLITSFYDLSRLESGEYPLVREKVDLHAVLSQLLAAFYGDLEGAGFAVTVELEEGLPPVWGDAAAVLRIFTNLIRNALDHGDGRLAVRLYRDGEREIASFTNGAGGLTEEDAAHVFDRFFTSDKNRTGQNTGLGLAIVKTLAEQMGHTVEAKVTEGDFTVTVCWNLAK